MQIPKVPKGFEHNRILVSFFPYVSPEHFTPLFVVFPSLLPLWFILSFTQIWLSFKYQCGLSYLSFFFIDSVPFCMLCSSLISLYLFFFPKYTATQQSPSTSHLSLFSLSDNLVLQLSNALISHHTDLFFKHEYTMLSQPPHARSP